VRRVLSHTSGVSNHNYHGWDPESALPPIEDSLSGKTGTGEVRIVDAPGSGFHYSGANYAILQLLIEDVSGQSFRDYLKANIFQRLRMSKSQYGLPPRFQEVMATPYEGLGNALPILRYNEFSAAGLTTTLSDLATFAAAGLKGPAGEPAGRGVLKEQTIALMQSPAPASRWADRDPYGPDPQYGFGYTVRPEQFLGKTGIGHGGSNNGWESFFQIVPDTGDGIVIMTNSSNGSAVVSSLLCSWRKWAASQSSNVECPTIEIREVLHGVYREKGAKATVARYRELSRDSKDKYDFGVLQLNTVGYELLRNGDMPGAIEIFRLNVEEFPQDANVYDSLGEAYLKQGDKALAIENYKKSLELNPQNDNARDVLKKLGVPQPIALRAGRNRT
jgi:CubicO group peptidase (beta-lactamase class C family)